MNIFIAQALNTIFSYCRKVGGLYSAYEQRENGTLPLDVEVAWDIFSSFSVKAHPNKVCEELKAFAECL